MGSWFAGEAAAGATAGAGAAGAPRTMPSGVTTLGGNTNKTMKAYARCNANVAHTILLCGSQRNVAILNAAKDCNYDARLHLDLPQRCRISIRAALCLDLPEIFCHSSEQYKYAQQRRQFTNNQH